MGVENDEADNSITVKYNPIPPIITWNELKEQFKLDIFDKEVQSAATYSYMWIAIQVGHICLGIILFFLLHIILNYFSLGKFPEIASFFSLALACSAFAFWEWRAYLDAVNRATSLFPLNKKGLSNNAVVATAYMWIGSLVGLSFLWGLSDQEGGGCVLFFLLLIGSLAPAPYWLKQKIIWQKAGLPYLFRLANTPLIIDEETAQTIHHNFIEQPSPPDGDHLMIIIHGPVDVGRTRIAAGIGSEMAFRNIKVRYLTFDKLIELIENDSDFPGPRNINYWDWRESQMLVIDDISPFLDPMIGENIDLFQNVINAKCNPFKNRHTVWVLGDEDPVPWKKTIKQLCQSASEPIMVQVAKEKNPSIIKL